MRTDVALLPDECGVYIFKTGTGKVLYVGKAVNIRSRVRSHLQDRKSEKEVRLRNEADTVEWIATGTELEALVLEDTLIKRYKPRFNIRLKDDKSYPYILITDGDYPAVHHVRGLTSGGGEYFGPHSDPRSVRRSIRWLRKSFPARSCRRDLSRPSRPCLEHHLGRCIAPCTGRVDKDSYTLIVKGLKMFLAGKREEVLNMLEKDMWGASSAEEYERAAMIRDILDGLKKARETQKVVLIKGGDLDIVYIDAADQSATVVKVRDGRVVDAVSFSLEGEESLMGVTEDFISSFYAISGYVPSKIVIGNMDLTPDRREELEGFLGEKKGGRVRLVRPRGDEHRSLLEMARRNMELFKAEKRKELHGEGVLISLKNTLSLSGIPSVIEAFDISHLGGTGTVASMVRFQDGRPKKSEYRRFRIGKDQNDDCLSMKEAVRRRYRRVLDQDGCLPDLILIDGGKGQLNAAREAFQELGILQPPDMVSIAKKEELLFRPGRNEPLVLKRSDPSLKLLQSARDEAHRFAVNYQRKLREKDIGMLTGIDGVGKARAVKLLTCFDSVDDMIEAGPEGMASRCSLGIQLCERIIAFLKKEIRK